MSYLLEGNNFRFADLLPYLFEGPTTGVEVGVANGRHAVRMLQQLPKLHLHLVDLWQDNSIKNVDYVSQDASIDGLAFRYRDPLEGQKSYDRMKKHTQVYQDRVTVHRCLSTEAVKLFGEKSLDFVYIDADHREASCYADLTSWKALIKHTGFLAGHDYGVARFGVTAAVDRFVRERNCELILFGVEYLII